MFVLNESYLQLFQGLDENAGPKIRKLYAEVVQIFCLPLNIVLAELWLCLSIVELWIYAAEAHKLIFVVFSFSTYFL